MIIKVYADESGTHAGSNYLMLSGYIGALGKWIALDRAWRRRLAREGLEYFHAVEHNRRRANEDLRYDLLKLCGKHLACGFTIRLEKRSYDNFYIAGHRPKGIQLDTMYGVCYRYLLSFLLTEIPQLLNRVDLRVDIMLEAGARGSRDAFRIHADFQKALREHEWLLGRVEFGHKKKHPGLQAADSLAHPSFVEERRELPLDLRPLRPTDTLVTARRTSRDTVIPPVFRLELNAENLAELKKRMVETALTGRSNYIPTPGRGGIIEDDVHH